MNFIPARRRSMFRESRRSLSGTYSDNKPRRDRDSIRSYPALTARPSHMDRTLANCKRRFLDGLRTGRMGMARARQILGRATKFHQDRRFMDHFTGFAADNVDAEDPIRLRICENLHETFCGLVHF